MERGAAGYRLKYTAKQLRLAKRRVAEESEEFREKYRWRSGIEATNAKLKRVLKIGRLRVRRLARVRHAVTLKALGLNIRQAVRVKKARILTGLKRRAVEMMKKLHLVSVIHPSVRMTSVPEHDETVSCLQLAA